VDEGGVGVFDGLKGIFFFKKVGEEEEIFNTELLGEILILTT